MYKDTRGEDNPLWEEYEQMPSPWEDKARQLYISQNLDMVEDGHQSGFVGWFDTTRGVRDIYRDKIREDCQVNA